MLCYLIFCLIIFNLVEYIVCNEQIDFQKLLNGYLKYEKEFEKILRVA